MKRTWRMTLAMLLALALAACGGDDGDSSSGSGGSTASPTGPAVNLASLAGNYVGSARITVSALGLSDTQTSTVNATVTAGGRLTMTFGDDVIATGQLAQDGSFRITDTLANAGLDECSGNINISGRVTASAINANISASGARCEGIPATASGSLSASRR